MSIIIHFASSPLLPPGSVPAAPACIVDGETTLEMGPELRHQPNVSMSQDESSLVELSASHILYKHPGKNITATSNATSRGLASCFGLPYQDHNYGAPPPPTPPSCSPQLSPVRLNGIEDEETKFSSVLPSNNNEETHEGSVTRCVCGFEHDDEYMICCDRCLVWQHVDCMGLDRNNIPETYMCEKCEPRKVDKHKAKVLQARKKVAMTDTSDESEEENSNLNLDQTFKTKNKSSKRKKDDEKFDSKSEQYIFKKSKTHLKHGKERMEIKRSKFRKRNKSKADSTSTADEEAQDAWECSLEWFETKHENAISNQYSSEIQLLANTLRNQGDEQKIAKQLQAQLCKVVELLGSKKILVSVSDLSRDQVIIEYKGKFLSTSQFHQRHPVFNKRVLPFVLFYKIRSDEEFCVDSTEYGNDARFVRRSCMPNSQICHVTLNGAVHLYISSVKDIKKDEEITIPFDFDYKECFREVECACDTEACLLIACKKNGILYSSCERKRKGRKHPVSADDDSSQSLTGGISSPTKSNKGSPLKMSSHAIQQVTVQMSSSFLENNDSKAASEEQEADEQVTEQKRKMTREERKIDAIMKAFDQMEKAAKRRKQALERIAQQKAQLQKVEELPEKQEVLPVVTKEEDKPAILPVPEVCIEDDKSIATNQPSKHKKGKRRRGSGTSSRRRTRTNSGGSDIFNNDEAFDCESTLQSLTTPTQCSEIAPVVLPTSPTVHPALSPNPPVTPVVPKTKRFLLHEWLQDKVESTVPVSCPLSIHSELSWNISTAAPTCYVRCTKDSPSTGGISAAHLRRSSTSGHCKQASGQGSAKKRWLRQAMSDCGSCKTEHSMTDAVNIEVPLSPPPNGSLSPNSQSEISNSDVSPPDDVITPLKKRRLMRESLEEISIQKSPTAPSEWITGSSGMSPDHSSSELAPESIAQPALTKADLGLKKYPSCITAKKYFSKMCKGNGLSTHLFKAFRKRRKKNGSHESMPNSTSSVENSILVESSENHPTEESSVKPSLECTSEKKDNVKFELAQNIVVSDLSQRTSGDCESTSEKAEIESLFKGNNICTDDVFDNVSKLCSDIAGKACDLFSSERQDLCAQELDAQASQPIEVESHNVRISSLPGKKECLQEPSSTSVDCVSSSSSSSSVNNAVIEDSVTCSDHHVFVAHVSSSCHHPGESALKKTDVPCPTSQSITSSTKMLELPSKSVVPETSQNNITSTVDSCTVLSPSVITSTSDSMTQPSSTVAGFSTAILPLESSIAQSASSHQNGVLGVISSVVLGGNAPSNTNGGSSVSSSAFVHPKANVCSIDVGNLKSASSTDKAPSTSISSNTSTTNSTNCGSATQKRKVSLSEYRMRKRDNSGNAQSNNDKKTSGCTLNAISTTEASSEKQVTLAALPLFKTIESTPKSAQISLGGKNSKKKETIGCSEKEQITSVSVQRENLTERLKREFGFDDDSDSEEKSDDKHQKSNESTLLPVNQSISPILSLCTQPPPPPPPPLLPPLAITNTSPTQFSYPGTQPYTQQPYVVAQVAVSQYISTQSPLAQGVVPVHHHINTPTALHSVRPLVQPTHTYSSALHTAVPRPTQVAYSATSSQSFVPLVQPPPPPPPSHPVYHSLFKPRLFK